MNTTTVRRPMKDMADNQRRWRDKIKKECTDRMKNARQDVIDKKREDKWMQKVLEQEWTRFKKEYEEAMHQEGIFDIDSLIEESIQEEYNDQESEFHLQHEQAELESALALYYEKNSHACVNCQKASLEPSFFLLNNNNNTSIVRCPLCGFYATEKCLEEIDQAALVHSSTCPQGLIEYALEPGTDNTVISVCNVCDLWNMFYM